MTDTKDIELKKELEDDEIKEELAKVNWLKIRRHGSVHVQIRNGIPTLAKIDRTVKLD